MDASGRASFVDLPHEIHLSIVRYLSLRPQDLFSVLKTCATLYSKFTSKSVWDTALETICIRDALFKPSYPVASMSVSQLQRATMAPELWNMRLRSGKPFTGASVKKISSLHKIARRLDYNRVYFVPGGRYLLEQVQGNISLWDLGLPSLLRDRATVWQETRIVDTIDAAGDDFAGREIVVHPSPDGERLRVWVLPCTSGMMGRFILQIYEIRPQDPSPKFRQLSRLDLLLPAWPFRWGVISMREDQIILHSADGIFIWDYIRQRYALWNTRSYTHSHTDLLFLSQSSIYLVKASTVMAWDVPEAKDTVPENKTIALLTWSDAPSCPPPKHVAHYGLEGAIYRPVGRSLSHWYNALDNFPPLFDVLEYRNTGGTRLVRCRFDVDFNGTSRVQRILAFPTFPNQESRCMSRVSGDTLFTLYQGCKKGFDFGLLYSPLPAHEGGDDGDDLKEGVDYGIVGVDSKLAGRLCSFTYCSASGRVAYSVVEGDENLGERFVNVFDYWDM